MTHDVAKAIYEYAGKEDIPRWEDLAPTIQISFIEEAEAALHAVSKYITFLGTQVELQDDESYIVKGTILSLAHMIDPKKPELEAD
jgi:hypothetical protein